MAIIGNKIYIRPMEMGDMDVYQNMLNDEVIAGNVVGWSFQISKQEQEDWFRQVAGDKRNRRFSIVLRDSDEVVGMVSLSNIDWHNRSAVLGIKLLSSCPKRQGIGTDAILTLARYAFEEVGLNRLDANWLDYNTASKKLYEKCGWREEGIKRQAIFKHGRFWDLKIAGITRNDYLKYIESDKPSANRGGYRKSLKYKENHGFCANLRNEVAA